LGGLIAGGVVAAFFGGCMLLGMLAPGAPTLSPPKPAIDKSPEAQAKRLALIQELVDKGVFDKVEKPGSLPHVYITSAFRAVPFDTKREFLGVVYAYYFDGAGLADAVVLKDAQSGKPVGSFSPASGVELDEPGR
jgi:hypothetical protein